MILAIGNNSIYEVDSFKEVKKSLNKHGEDIVLFKQDNCLVGEYLSFSVNNGQCIYNIIIDGIEYDIADFSAIWYIKPRLPKELFSYEPIEHRNFIHKQFFEMRRTIWSMFNDKKWLNNPWSIDKAENKPYQLLVALESGFNTPDTVITSDPELVMDFYNKHSKDIIVKLLSSSIIPDHVIYTNKVTDEYMSEISSVKMSPSIFQETVKKDHELRITVVGNRLFPVKIYSQEDSETSLDWRKKPKFNDFKVRMESAVLPREVETKIFVFMNKLGLDFGCIDMIVDENGDYIFLEINSNGQWYFVQLNTGAKIAEAIASELIS